MSRVVIIMPHDPRRFVETVDFVTSPGHLHGADGRRRAGLTGAGPVALVTGRARFGFDAGTVVLDRVFPPFSPEDAIAGIPWGAGVDSRARTAADFARSLRETAREIGFGGM